MAGAISGDGIAVLETLVSRADERAGVWKRPDGGAYAARIVVDTGLHLHFWAKACARGIKGAAFDVRQFHDLALTSGPMPMTAFDASVSDGSQRALTLRCYGSRPRAPMASWAGRNRN